MCLKKALRPENSGLRLCEKISQLVLKSKGLKYTKNGCYFIAGSWKWEREVCKENSLLL